MRNGRKSNRYGSGNPEWEAHWQRHSNICCSDPSMYCIGYDKRRNSWWVPNIDCRRIGSGFGFCGKAIPILLRYRLINIKRIVRNILEILDREAETLRKEKAIVIVLSEAGFHIHRRGELTK